jgi:hypothetical protein
MRETSGLSIACALWLFILGCSSPPMNVEQEWSLIGRSKEDVEDAFEKANYFRSDRTTWAPRGSSKIMDNFNPVYDSANTLVAITRLRFSADLTAGPALFERALSEREQVFGNPETDTTMSEYGDDEHQVIWKAKEPKDVLIVAVSLRNRAAVFQTSYLKGSEKLLLK